jgi:hypothetical protein
MIKISVDFKDGKKFDQLIRYIQSDRAFFEAQDVVRDLAYDTVSTMKEVINTERKNPTRPDLKLENAIAAEDISTTGGVEIGIGRISTLIAKAPYFELINDGGTYITKKTHIVPTTYFADPGTGFVTFKEGSSHTITGIDYVGKAVRNLSINLHKKLNEWGAEYVKGMSNPDMFGRTYVAKWGKKVQFGEPGSASGGAK